VGSDPGTVVIGSHDDPGVRLFEASGMIGIGDALALTSLLHAQRQAGGSSPQVRPANQIRGMSREEYRRGNLILIGGPDVNEITREVMQALGGQLRFGDPARHEVFIEDTKTGQKFLPRLGDSGDVVLDYGLSIRAPNPFNANRLVLIVAGSFGYGTFSAASVCESSELLGRVFPDGDVKNFEALVSTVIRDQWPQQPRLELVNRLP
jgi:hypothetical protein